MRFIISLLFVGALAYGVSVATRTEAPRTTTGSAPPPAGGAAGEPRAGVLPFALTFTQAQLQAAAGEYFPQSMAGATLTDPVVQLRASGELALDMKAQLSFIRTTANVVATPYVSAGRPAARITSATIGGQPLPDSVRASLADQVARAIDTQVPRAVVVTTIEIVAGRLTVAGTVSQ